jgi:hypothetical protein
MLQPYQRVIYHSNRAMRKNLDCAGAEHANSGIESERARVGRILNVRRSFRRIGLKARQVTDGIVWPEVTKL